MTTFDRKVFFDSVRASLFGGSLDQRQVDGMNFKLDQWEANPLSDDLRWLSYCFATSFWETARTMMPIEEIGKGKGHSYGRPDAETGQTYYGRSWWRRAINVEGKLPTGNHQARAVRR